MPSTYKKNTPLEERKQKSKKMLSMYPNRIPVIVEMSTSSASYTTYIDSSLVFVFINKYYYIFIYNVIIFFQIQIQIQI